MRARRMPSERRSAAPIGSPPVQRAPRGGRRAAARVGEHDAANVPEGEDVEVVYSTRRRAREPRARGGPRTWPARAPARGAAGGADRAAAHDRGGGHARQDDDLFDARVRAARRRPAPRAGWSAGPWRGQANAHWGEGEWLVVEADESDRSMLMLDVEIAVLTNVELDHHATFGSLAQLREAFREFLARARTAIVVWDRPDLSCWALRRRCAGRGGRGNRIVPYDAPRARARRRRLALRLAWPRGAR